MGLGLVFENNEELENILNELSQDKYNSMLPYIKNNFEISKKFRKTKDDQLFDIIKRKLIDEN